MKKNVFINGTACISAQKTFDDSFFEQPIVYHNELFLSVVKPEYQRFISPVAVRRMSSGVKNSIVASTMAILEAQISTLDAIICGTGFGCLQDSEKFLKSIIENNEEHLTPTSFIQSTHNTVAGQIALEQKCQAYNFTYVQGALSFHAALLDAFLMFKTANIQAILVGGVDEMAEHTCNLFRSIGQFKTSTAFDFFNQKTPGCIPAEGCGFFVLSPELNHNTYCELIDVHFTNEIPSDDLYTFFADFLRKNNIDFEEVDVLIHGENGDSNFDDIYTEAKALFPKSSSVAYKQFFGEFLTASAIATWLAAKILKHQNIPAIFNAERKGPIKYVLVYNQYRNREHGLILLKNV